MLLLIHEEKILSDFLNEYGFLFKKDFEIIKEQDKEKTNKIKQVKEKYKKEKEKLLKDQKSSIEKLKDYVKDVGEDIVSDVSSDIGEKIERKIQRLRAIYLVKKNILKQKEVKEIGKVKQLYRTAPKIVSGLFTVAIAMYGANKLYKTEKQKIEKICKNKTGQEKKKCIKNIEIKLLKKKLSFLNDAVLNCNFSKDPVKCKVALHKEMLKLREKIKDKSIEFEEKVSGD